MSGDGWPQPEATLNSCSQSVLRYAAINGSPPTSLAQLQSIEGHINKVTDGWGRPILWRVESDEAALYSRLGT